MAEPIETLYIELQGRLDGLERTLKQAEQRLAQAGQDGGEAFSKGFGSGVEQVITKIGSIGAIVAGGAIGLGAFDGLVRSVFSLAQEADRANTQAQLLAATLERNGISATAAEQSFRATADALGVLPQQLNESSKLLINYGATLDQVAKLQEIGGASALAAGRSAADGADLIAQAITTENSALLNGIGIASNLSTAYQNYGKEVGKTVEQLTAQEKAQAAVNYLLKETQSEVEALPTLLGGLAGQQSKLNNEFKQLQLTLGEALIPAVTGAIRVLNQLLDNLPTVISVATTLAAIIGAQRLAGSFAVLNLSVAQGASALAGWAATTVTTTTVTTALNGALNTLRTFFLTSPAVIIAAGAALITFAQQASAAIAAAEKAAQASDQAFNKTESSRISALRTSSSEIDQLKGRIASLQAALSSIQLGELGGNAEATAAKIKQLRGELAALQAEQAKQNTAQATSNDLFKEARTLVENLQKAQDSLSARQIFAAQQAIEAFTKANKDGSAVISAVRAAIAEQNAQLKENEKATKSATKAVSEWDNYLKSERLEAYRRGLEGMTEAQLRQEATNQRSARAIEQLQAATARLNEIQTRRIELERQLAAQAANAPLEQSLARLERQYNLGTISARQYLDAANALQQSFSKQFAAATKGTEEYERLRGVVLRLRDVQESLKDTLEETSLALQRQQAAAPLQNTIESLADAYKSAEISTVDYKTAIDSLIRSESVNFAALEKGTTAYDDQRQIILQLREIQADLISQLEREAKVRSELQKAITDQVNALRVLSESGQESFIQNVAQQYVELSGLLSSGQVNARAAELADSLTRSLSSVQIDEGTRSAIKALLDELKKLADTGEEAQTKLAQDIEIPQSLFQFGSVIEEISAAFRTNTALVQGNAITTDRALAVYEEQARIVQDVVDSLIAQLSAQQDANASTDELAATTERLGKSKSLLDQLNESILQLGGPSADALQIVGESVLEVSEIVDQFSTEGGLAQAFVVPPETIDFKDAIDAINVALQTARASLSLGTIDLERFTAAQDDATTQLQEFITAILDQAQALVDSGQLGSAAYNALIRLAIQAKQAFDDLNSEIVASSPKSANALLLIEKATLQWQDTVQQTSEIVAREFAPPSTFIDFEDGLKGIGAELDAVGRQFDGGVIDIQTYQVAIINTIDDLQLFSDTLRILAENYLQSADAAEQSFGKNLLNLSQNAQNSIAGLRDRLYEVGASAPSIEGVKDEITKFGSQLADVQLPDRITEEVEDLIDILQFVPPDVFVDYRDGLTAIGVELEDVKTSFQDGVIGIEDYQFALINTINDLQSYSKLLREVAAGYLQSVDSADRALGANLLRLAQNAEKQIRGLNDQIYEIGTNAPRVENVKDEVTKLGSQLASVQIPDTIVDAITEITEELGRFTTEGGLAQAFVVPPESIDFKNALDAITTSLLAVRQSLQLGIVDLDGFTAAQENASAILQEFIATVLDQAQALADSGQRGSSAYVALIALANQAKTAFDELTSEIVQSSPRSAAALAIIDKATLAWQDTVAQTSEILAREFAPPPVLVDFKDALGGIGDELDALGKKFADGSIDIEGYQTAIGNVIDDLEVFSNTISSLAQSYLQSADAADQALGAELTRLAQQAQQSIEGLRDKLYQVGATAPRVEQVKDEVTKLGSQLANVQLPDKLIDQVEDLIDILQFVPPDVFIDYREALDNIGVELEDVKTQFEEGAISIEDYQFAVSNTISDLDSFSRSLRELATFYLSLGEASDRALGANLLRLAQNAEKQVKALNNEIYKIGSLAPRVTSVKDEVTKLGSELADVQIPDVLVQQIEEVIDALDFAPSPALINFQDAIEGIGQELVNLGKDFSEGRVGIEEYQAGIINTINDLVNFQSTLLELSRGYLESADSAEQAFGAEFVQLAARAQAAIEALRDRLYQIGAAAPRIEQVKDEVTKLGSGLAQVQLPDKLVEQIEQIVDALDFVPDAKLIDFREALAGVTDELDVARDSFLEGGSTIEQFQSGIIAAIDDLNNYVAAIRETAQAYLNSSDAADRAIGRSFLQLAKQAQSEVKKLTDELYRVGSTAPVFVDVKDEITKLGGELAAVQIPDRIFEDIEELVDAFDLAPERAFVDFSAGINEIISDLVRLDAQFASGTIVIEDYQNVLVARIDDLAGLVVILQESQQALEAIGESGGQSGQQIAAAISAANTVIEQLRNKLYDVGSQQPRVSGVKDEITKLGSELADVQLPDRLPEQLDELQTQASDFAVPATLIDFRNALESISTQLRQTSDQFQRGNLSVDDYRQTLLNTVGDLEVFAGTLDQLSQQYLNSGDAADQAFGAQLQQLVISARNQIQDLGTQLFNLNVDALVIDDLVQGFDRLDRTLARVQLPDILPDAALRNLLTAAGIDFGNFAQLGVALNNIPEPLRASSTLFGDFADLVDLSAQAQQRLAEAAGLALSQNQELANQIRILAQDLVVTGAISTDVALQYLELANQVGNLSETTKAGIDPFKALSTLTFENFRELSISLDRIINPLTESGNAADLLQSALREAADAERLLSGAAADVDNQFTRQAETIREYAEQLEKTGQVAPDLITKLRSLARSLDIQAPLEEGRKKTEQLKNELLEAVDAFAGFGNLDIAGFDGLVSLSQGIAKLIGGDILGGIQSILAPYADLLEPILRPLGGAFSDLLDSLNPMISALGELLNSVITPLVQIASSVLLPVFEALGAAIKVISDGIKFLFDGLVSIYNATVGQLFGQIGDFTDASGLIQRIEDVVGKIGDAAKEAIIEMSRTVQETLASSFASALSDGIFEAISTGDLDTAKKALEERLKQIVVQVIIDTAVKAALATAAVSEVLKNLSDAIAYAIATGDWSGVGDAVTKAVSTVTGIMQQLSQQLTPVLGGLIPPPSQQPPGQGANPSLPNPFAAQQLPLSPQITVPLLDSAKLVGTAGTQISDASTALVEGLQGLELDSVASDMARSSRDFRAAVDDLGALLSNRTNWAGVNSR